MITDMTQNFYRRSTASCFPVTSPTLLLRPWLMHQKTAHWSAMGVWPTLMNGQKSKIHFWKQILEGNKFSNLPQSNHHMQITTAISSIKIPVASAGPPLRMLSFLYTGSIIVGGSQH
ncbi:hypothetical protein D5086_003947 [Populus alba]|uniref:Uncharacterized protein n=1 Tax=Populus alba TaxID=43335 RepID=A0ACC4D7X4_POPAL